MRRRDFLSAAGALVPIAALPPSRFALRWTRNARGAAARTFEITTRVELDAAGPARAWLPLPLARETAYQHDRGHTIDGNASRARVEQVDGASMVVAEWRGGPAPVLLVISRVTTMGHRVDLRTPPGK